MIRDRADIVAEINSNSNLLTTFNTWSLKEKEYFLDICTGTRGVKMLYDCFFKEILSPENTPSRLSIFLSELLKRKVTVKQVLPNDSEHLGDEMSLVITDIVVELEDGSIANVEVQKIGYAFPGERASCYSADLLLRQYKRVRDEKRESFSYKNLAPVYTIVFMEDSSKIFKAFPDAYVHYVKEVSNTGIQLNLLQNFIFISIDIFLVKLHNEGINSNLDAWLTFLACDEPEIIIKLIEDYPEFKPMHSQLYDYCRNIEDIMSMFSKELQMMDRNTVKYMIDDLQEQLDSANNNVATLTSQNSLLESKNSALESKNTALKNNLKSRDMEIARLKKILEDNNIKS